LEQQQAAVFIDGGYMDKMQKLLGVLNIDMAAFSRWAANGYDVFRTYYYDCLPYQSGRPTLEQNSGGPVFVQKRIDLQLGIDIGVLVEKNRVGCIVLVSGDSDMIPAVEVARTEGLIVRLIHGPINTYHKDLWTEADERTEMTEGNLSNLRRPTK
jgi:hypothetical protein